MAIILPFCNNRLNIFNYNMYSLAPKCIIYFCTKWLFSACIDITIKYEILEYISPGLEWGIYPPIMISKIFTTANLHSGGCTQWKYLSHCRFFYSSSLYSHPINLSHLTFSRIVSNLRFTKKNILTFKLLPFILFFLQTGKNVCVGLKYGDKAKNCFFLIIRKCNNEELMLSVG